MKELIEFDEFLEIEKKLDIRIGKINTSERIPKSTVLLKLSVNFGNEDRTVVTNIGRHFEPDQLIGLSLPFIMNLKPMAMMGVTSEAMIMVADNNSEIEIKDFAPGSKLL